MRLLLSFSFVTIGLFASCGLQAQEPIEVKISPVVANNAPKGQSALMCKKQEAVTVTERRKDGT